MNLTSLEDQYRLSDDMALSPLFPEKKSGCSSCGKKGININISNNSNANGNTASGNSSSNSTANNGFSNTSRGVQPQIRTQERGASTPVQVIQPKAERIEPKTADKTETLLTKILAKLNEPRPKASTIEVEKVPDRVKTVVKEREVRIPVERKVNYVKPIETTEVRERQVPYVKDVEINIPQDRIKTQVIEREVPRFFDRIKEKILVIRANQPPSPASFS